MSDIVNNTTPAQINASSPKNTPRKSWADEEDDIITNVIETNVDSSEEFKQVSKKKKNKKQAKLDQDIDSQGETSKPDNTTSSNQLNISSDIDELLYNMTKIDDALNAVNNILSTDNQSELVDNLRKYINSLDDNTYKLFVTTWGREFTPNEKIEYLRDNGTSVIEQKSREINDKIDKTTNKIDNLNKEIAKLESDRQNLEDELNEILSKGDKISNTVKSNRFNDFIKRVLKNKLTICMSNRQIATNLSKLEQINTSEMENPYHGIKIQNKNYATVSKTTSGPGPRSNINDGYKPLPVVNLTTKSSDKYSLFSLDFPTSFNNIEVNVKHSVFYRWYNSQKSICTANLMERPVYFKVPDREGMVTSHLHVIHWFNSSYGKCFNDGFSNKFSGDFYSPNRDNDFGEYIPLLFGWTYKEFESHQTDESSLLMFNSNDTKYRFIHEAIRVVDKNGSIKYVWMHFKFLYENNSEKSYLNQVPLREVVPISIDDMEIIAEKHFEHAKSKK